jgi:hypothetical protein
MNLLNIGKKAAASTGGAGTGRVGEKVSAEADKVTEKSERAVQEARPWIDKLARIGYCAKGTVYAVIGMLSVLTAAGFGGRIPDSKGALSAIGSMPVGGVLLFILAIGLLGFFVWRVVQAAADPDGHGSSWKGIFVRVSHLAGGLMYAALAYHAVSTMLHAARSGVGGEQSTTAAMLRHPFGAFLIGMAGVSFVGYGLYQLVKAYKGSFTRVFKKASMREQLYQAVVRLARFGIVARGIVFGLIGYFLIATAVKADPSQTKGLDEALAELAKQPFGRWQLGAAALGFIAYGLYMYALARYRKTVGEDRK